MRSNPDPSFCKTHWSSEENGIRMAKDHHEGAAFISLKSSFFLTPVESRQAFPGRKWCKQASCTAGSQPAATGS